MMIAIPVILSDVTTDALRSIDEATGDLLGHL
jgi:hypothetical protein